MLSYLQVISVSILQGLTEFLPVSSSAHLILLPTLLHWPDQGLLFDIAVHFGTLLAVIVYFREIIFKLLRDSGCYFLTGEQTEYTRLSFNLILATIPIGIVGILFKIIFGSSMTGMRAPLIIGWSTIGFGLLLGWADRFFRNNQGKRVSIKHGFYIGLAQICALIPGASRSGVTLTAGLMCGYPKKTAAEFSFLLSIPVIVLAMISEIPDLFKLLHTHALPWEVSGQFLLGILISGLTGFSVIKLFLKWVETVGVGIFVIYRIILGAVILTVF